MFVFSYLYTPTKVTKKQKQKVLVVLSFMEYLKLEKKYEKEFEKEYRKEESGDDKKGET